MALNLFDYLSEMDNKRISNYCGKWGVVDGYCGNAIYLTDWANNKQRLFRLLGGQLIYKKPVCINKPSETLYKEIQLIKENSPFPNNYIDFINKFFKENKITYAEDEYAKTYESYIYELKHKLTSFNLVNILAGGVTDYTDCSHRDGINFIYGDKKSALRIPKGTKVMKAIQKTLTYLDAPQNLMQMFDTYRNQISVVTNDKMLKGNLCISIHPLDYMTMSDNGLKWSSCMSWINEGCYHLGTVEMMNSNNVLCCYIEQDKEYFDFSNEDRVTTKDSSEWTWNNKKYRQLFYITNDIILGGKAYPYRSDDLSILFLKEVRELARRNLSRVYKFGPEAYNDMKHVTTYYRMEKQRRFRKINPKKHNIIFDTNAMYNDMINDSCITFWCVRNKVEKNTIINLSGKTRCIECGKSDILIEDDSYSTYDYDFYNSKYEHTITLLCDDCRRHRYCEYCDEDSSAREKVYKLADGSQICEKCFADKFRTCPECGDPFDYRASHPFYFKDNEDVKIIEGVRYDSSIQYNERYGHEKSYADLYASGIAKIPYGDMKLDEETLQTYYHVRQGYCCNECFAKIKTENIHTEKTILSRKSKAYTWMKTHNIDVWNENYNAEMHKKYTFNNLKRVDPEDVLKITTERK